MWIGAQPTAAQPSERPHSAESPTKAPRRALVQRFAAVGVPKTLAKSVEEAAVLSLGKQENMLVVSPAELEQALAATELHAELGCDHLDECLGDIQRQLDVQALVSGKVSRLGSNLLLTIGLTELQLGMENRRVTREGKDIRTLLAHVPDAIAELLGTRQPKPQFRLQQGDRLPLAVMPLAARGVKSMDTAALTQILAAELNQIEGVSVISRDDIEAILKKVQVEGELGCIENLACIVEIGAALGLSKLVTGSVGRVQDTFVLSLQLIDTRKVDVQNRVLESFDGDASELRHAIKLAAHQLVGVHYETNVGRVEFSFDMENAQAFFAGKRRPLIDRQLELTGLPPGRYSLRVIAEDYNPLQTDVYVPPYGANIRSFKGNPLPTPWYKTWWVWTIVGVVAVSTTVTVVALSQPPNDLGIVDVSLELGRSAP